MIAADCETVVIAADCVTEVIAAGGFAADCDYGLPFSVHSGAHLTLFRKVLALMKEKGLDDVLLTGGGIIPEKDRATLAAEGVGRLFGPGTPLKELAAYIAAETAVRRPR